MYRIYKFAAILIACFCAISLTGQMAQADRANTQSFQVKTNYNKAGKTTKKVRKTRTKKRYAKKSRKKSRRGYHGYRHATPALVAKIKRHARAAGVPSRIGIAVVKQESSFNPRARGSAGEIGLMQLKCSTARGMGYRGKCSGLYNVSVNLRYGMRYLKRALRRGSVGYYNAGIGAKRLPARAKKYARQVASKS